jgi:glycosyltransferase involved in cell wall biosynthesis
MDVAYLINQYPKVSHSFIRREIMALERQGVRVMRVALRGWADAIVDPDDRAEREQTRYVLNQPAWCLLACVLRVALQSPRYFVAGLLQTWRLSRSAERSALYHLIYFVEACQVLLWARAAGVRHLHAHFGTNPAEVVALAHALGGPSYSFTVHGPEEFDGPKALKLAEKMRHAAFVVAISSYGRSQLYRWLNVAEWPKVAVVHCGLEPGFHQIERPPVPQRPRLVCVGRLCEQKGQPILLHAAMQLVQEGVEFELVLAGDGEMRAELEDFIARSGLQALVRITGWISSEQVRDEILAARALVLPSFAEGLPVVLMEAMALERPVLTTYVAGIPELVQHGKSGWLFPAGDVQALAQALRECLAESPETLQAMGRAGRERVLSRHDIDIEATKLVQLLRFHCAAAGPHPRAAPSRTRQEAVR